MTNPNLPDDLLARIAKLMAAKHWWYMQSLLRSGNRGKTIVYRRDVLKEANIFNMCSDPDDIMFGGRHRKFFERCLDADNPTAIYYEGLRLATKDGDIEGAVNLLLRNVPTHADATLASAMLCICKGSGVQAGHLLQLFSIKHYPLNSEEVGDMCEELINELIQYGASHNTTYGVFFDYPDDGEITTPLCALKCVLSMRKKDVLNMVGPYKHRCRKCTIWWCARRISQMLW